MPFSGSAIYKKNRRSAAAVNRLLDTHVLAHFHTAGALSAPSLRLPLEGKAIKFSVSLTYDVFPRSLPKQRKASTIEESSPRRQSYDYTNGHS